MPDTIRMTSGGTHAHPLQHGFAGVLGVVVGAPAAAAADGIETAVTLPSPLAGPFVAALATLERHEIAALALTLGAIIFSVVTAIALVRTRNRAQQARAAARAEIVALKEAADRARTLLLSEPQIIVVWGAGDEEPEIAGDTGIVTHAPVPRRALAFGTWLDADKARAVEEAVDALRGHGEPFNMPVTTLAGRHVEIDGRAIGGRAVLRIKDLSGVKQDFADLAQRYRGVLRDIDALRTLAETLSSPIWVRDHEERLVWANAAYAHAVEARDAADAVARGLELLDSSARHDAHRSRGHGETYMTRLPVIVAGNRRMLDVIDLPTREGSAGIGVDASEVEAMRAEMAHIVDAHRRTLDQLSIAVATFGADQRLTFYNAAYRQLWGLDAQFLDQSPTDTAVLDQLCVARRLPEQVNFRQWTGQLHEAYRAIEPQEHSWHLPDGRTLRVVTTPNPEGGVTYLFDDVSERLDLERRYDALIRVQGETLDNLVEGVAVFGSDGRLRLHNPAFARMWRLVPPVPGERPHIEAVISLCRPLYADDAWWQSLRAAITGLERRESVAARLERGDGSVVECATLPLPDGATLVTFQDVTDSVNVERVLRERNDALELADELKSEFVHHVSYELRTPLTTIIGFAHLLDDRATGALSEKQREYLGYITSSSAALLAIINDILDLASVDAGAMQLDLRPIDIRKAMDEAAEGVRDRLAKKGVTLDTRVDAEIGSFTADGRRVRQILYNLLSNAVGFSPPHETVTLMAERRPEAIAFTVTDRGPGIPPEIVGRVFDRFETYTLGSDHRGVGLGLSIVRSFVELHGGRVTIDSAIGRGTSVVCVFPLEHRVEREAAE